MHWRTYERLVDRMEEAERRNLRFRQRQDLFLMARRFGFGKD